MKHLYARRLLRLCLRLRLKHQQHHLSPSSISTSSSSSSSISSSAMARKTVKEAVNSFADKTSMHGVPSLVRARNPRAKLFWSLVCVVAMGMFIFMLISLILKYFQYPVIVKVDQVSISYLCIKMTVSQVGTRNTFATFPPFRETDWGWLVNRRSI